MCVRRRIKRSQQREKRGGKRCIRTNCIRTQRGENRCQSRGRGRGARRRRRRRRSTGCWIRAGRRGCRRDRRRRGEVRGKRASRPGGWRSAKSRCTRSWMLMLRRGRKHGRVREISQQRTKATKKIWQQRKYRRGIEKKMKMVSKLSDDNYASATLFFDFSSCLCFCKVDLLASCSGSSWQGSKGQIHYGFGQAELWTLCVIHFPFLHSIWLQVLRLLSWFDLVFGWLLFVFSAVVFEKQQSEEEHKKKGRKRQNGSMSIAERRRERNEHDIRFVIRLSGEVRENCRAASSLTFDIQSLHSNRDTPTGHPPATFQILFRSEPRCNRIRTWYRVNEARKKSILCHGYSFTLETWVFLSRGEPEGKNRPMSIEAPPQNVFLTTVDWLPASSSDPSSLLLFRCSCLFDVVSQIYLATDSNSLHPIPASFSFVLPVSSLSALALILPNREILSIQCCLKDLPGRRLQQFVSSSPLLPSSFSFILPVSLIFIFHFRLPFFCLLLLLLL